MPFDNKTYRQNQKVFVVYWPGGPAALCCGRNRGKGRWIKRWINWDNKKIPRFIDIDMPESSKPAQIINQFEELCKKSNLHQTSR